MGSMPGALFHDRCRWASHKPGIKVAPMPSMTVWPPPTLNPGVRRDEPLVTCRIRFPWTETSPVYGFSPDPSMMRTLVKTTPFDPPNLSSAMGPLLHRLLGPSTANVPPHACARICSEARRAHSFGCSICVQWPHLGSVLSLALLIFSASPRAAPGGAIGSSSPVTMRVGQFMSRRSAPLADAKASQDCAKPSESWRRWLSRTNASTAGLSALVEDASPAAATGSAMAI